MRQQIIRQYIKTNQIKNIDEKIREIHEDQKETTLIFSLPGKKKEPIPIGVDEEILPPVVEYPKKKPDPYSKFFVKSVAQQKEDEKTVEEEAYIPTSPTPFENAYPKNTPKPKGFEEGVQRPKKR